MAIVLGEQLHPVRRVLTGSDSVVVTAGQEVKIEAGETELLVEEVPEGKQWRVQVSVRIEESEE